MRRLEVILAWLLVGLGILQWLATPFFFRRPEEPAFWFFGGGFTLVLVGALNLLRRTYGERARGLLFVSVVANLVLAGFWIAMTVTLPYKFTRYVAPYIALGIIVLNAGVSLNDFRRSRIQGSDSTH